MSETEHSGLQSISVRRAKLADAGAARYRVYSSPSEFVVVIAESALMAVRLSEIATPYKIVRDMGADGASIGAEQMAAREEVPEQVMLSMERKAEDAAPITSALNAPKPENPPFTPLHLSDLQNKGGRSERILSPSIASEIDDTPPAPMPPPPAAPLPSAAPAEPVAVTEETPTQEVPAAEAPAAAEPELSPAEKVNQMADALLPPTEGDAPEEKELSPEEVEKLLNG